MSFSRKAMANRANAQSSTGPRSAAGKQRSRVNALKHGLAVAVTAVPALSQEMAYLIQAIAGEDQSDPKVLQAAARVAEAAIDVVRIRRAKTDLLNKPWLHSGNLPLASAEAVMSDSRQSAVLESRGWKHLETLDRYERRALSRRRTAIRAFDDARAAAQTTPSGEPRLHDSLLSEG